MYEVFERLLELKNVSIADVSRATGINQSVFSNWKARKNLISGKNALLIADYFGVSLDYLMTGKEKESYYTDVETAKIAQEIVESKEMAMLFRAARGASTEDLKTTYQMLLALKRKEQHDDPC